MLEPARRLEAALVAQRDEQLVLLGGPGRDGAALARSSSACSGRTPRPPDGRASRAACPCTARRAPRRRPRRARGRAARRARAAGRARRGSRRCRRATIAFVRGVIAASTAAGSRLSVLRVDVGEHGRRALVDRAVRRGDERVRRRDHLVAGADAGEAHAEVQAGRAGRDRRAVRRADRVGEQRLEARAGRPERQPARAQHLEHELLVALVDPRRGEVDPLGCGAQRR